MNLTITKLTMPAAAANDALAPAPAAAQPDAASAAADFAGWLDQLAAALPGQPLAAADAAAGDDSPAGDDTDTTIDTAAQPALAAQAQPLPTLSPHAAAAQPTLAPLAATALPTLAPLAAAAQPLPMLAALVMPPVAPTAAPLPAGADGAAPGQPLLAPAAIGAPALAAAAAPASATNPVHDARATAPQAAIAAGAADSQAAPDQLTPAWGVAAPSSSPAPAPSTLALSGTPPAWRQALHEALGERLQVQVGNRVEQAVIRLEPPDLGRVDIAIRYSAGSLQVALSATHSEVVRQLHSVSDNLRNDLAGRQYSEVTVSVSQVAQASRAQQGGFAGFGDQQRQRQGGREQDQAAPGAALADAGGNHAFSLNAHG